MKFKVGDKVRQIHGAFEGVITQACANSDSTDNLGPYYWYKDNAGGLDCQYELYLELVEPHITAQPSEFKVGDRVEFNYNGEATGKGRTGTILRLSCGNTGQYIEARFDDNKQTGYCWPNELRLLSPQSPQPQTTEPKEDTMKPYAVIYHNLIEPSAVVESYHTTEEEAKEAAESRVAKSRANLTTKIYFAITIVNTKTGKLVGSVVDAPPQVEWNKE